MNSQLLVKCNKSLSCFLALKLDKAVGLLLLIASIASAFATCLRPLLLRPPAEVIEACQRSVSLHHLLDFLLRYLSLKARHVHKVSISLIDMLRGGLLSLLHRCC